MQKHPNFIKLESS